MRSALLLALFLFTVAVTVASGLAFAQTPVPVGAPFDATPVLVLAAIAAVAGGLIFLRRKNRAAFDAVAARAKDVQHTVGTGINTLVTHAGTFIHGASTKLHEFEAHTAPPPPPAVSLTPTHPAIQATAQLQSERVDNAALSHQPYPSFLSDDRAMK